MARVVLEMIASAPEKGRKLAVIVTTNSSPSTSSEERDVIKSIEIDENDANLFEDYDDESDDDDYTELRLPPLRIRPPEPSMSSQTIPNPPATPFSWRKAYRPIYPPVASSSANTEATPGVQFLRVS